MLRVTFLHAVFVDPYVKMQLALFARNSVSPDQLKPAMAFFVRLISCEFTLLLIDKGGWIHSHFIMESSDISRSVGYQVT